MITGYLIFKLCLVAVVGFCLGIRDALNPGPAEPEQSATLEHRDS